MSISSDLGMYLGVNLVHGIFSFNHCNHVIKKVSKKLAGWKAKCLSFAGKNTLIKAVTSTIPNYVMQMLKLPTFFF